MSEIKTYLPWLLSAITIYTMWQAGNKSKWTWAIGGANQVLWFIWILSSESWGLLPMNFAMCIIYARNHLKWNRSNLYENY
jgi:hypothetical protein